jgi:hypothetical protein
MMINLVECEMTTNEDENHQGDPLLDHPLDDMLESMKEDSLKRKAI